MAKRNSTSQTKENRKTRNDNQHWTMKCSCWCWIKIVLSLLFAVTFLFLAYKFVSNYSESDSVNPLKCYHCQSVENLEEVEDFPVEKDCWKNPINTFICKSGEYCGSAFQHIQDISGKIGRRVMRYCTEGKGDDCHEGMKNGIMDIMCTCKKDRCIPIRFSS